MYARFHGLSVRVSGFKGVYNIYEQQLNLFTPNKQRVTEKVEVDINSNNLDEQVGAEFAEQLRNASS